MQFHNVFQPVQNLLKPDIKPGGLCWVIFFRWQDVDAWPFVDPSTGVISSDLIFKPSAKLYTLQTSEKGRIFKESLEQATAGPFIKAEVAGMLPGNTANHVTSVAAMQFNRFGLLFKDRCGLVRLMGCMDAGALFDHDYTTGDIHSTRLRNIKFTFEASTPLPIYMGGNIMTSTDIIPIGSQNATDPTLTPLITFEVGAAGAPMADGQSTYTNPAMAGKRVWVFIDGVKLSSVVNAGKRYVIKDTASDTITINGGVSQGEAVEIFIY